MGLLGYHSARDHAQRQAQAFKTQSSVEIILQNLEDIVEVYK